MNKRILDPWPAGFLPLADVARTAGITTAAAYDYIQRGVVPKKSVRTQSTGKTKSYAVQESVALPIFKAAPSAKKPPPDPAPPPPVSRAIFSGAEPVVVPPPPPRRVERVSSSSTSPPSTESANEQYNAVKIQKERLAIEKAEMELKIARGRLLEVDVVSVFLSTLAVETRQALLAIPPRVAPIIAAERDPRAVSRLLESEIAQALEALGKLSSFVPVQESE